MDACRTLAGMARIYDQLHHGILDGGARSVGVAGDARHHHRATDNRRSGRLGWLYWRRLAY